MINIAISLLVGVGIFFIFFYLNHWIIGLIIGQLAAIGIFLLLAKLIMKKITNIVETATAELTKGQFDRAIAILEGGYKYKYRHPLIASQLNSQIGTIYYYKKDFKKAEEYLQKGMATNYVGQCMLGILYMKKKDIPNMEKAFKSAIRFTGKESIVWSLYAYCLNSVGKKEAAIEVLTRGQKKLPNDENIKANLSSLQNNQRMRMRAYKDLWSVFMLEKTIIRQQSNPPFGRSGGGFRKFYHKAK